MPTFEFRCSNQHDFELRCSISSKPESPPCPTCEAPAKQVFLTPPPIWIPGVTHQTVLDYPGSKAQKAGHVHTHGYKPATKVQSGYGGVTSTGYRHHDEVADWVKPDATRGSAPGESS